MATTRYYVMNGKIRGEQSPGQNRLNYISDALGSTVAMVDAVTKNVVGTARFKPYGATLASTGIQTAFGWNGAKGIRQSFRTTPRRDLRSATTVLQR